LVNTIKQGQSQYNPQSEAPLIGQCTSAAHPIEKERVASARIVVFPLNPPSCNEFRLIYIRAEIQFDGGRAGGRACDTGSIMPLAARAFDISTPSHSLSPGARRSALSAPSGKENRKRVERAGGRRIIIVRSNPITGAAPKDIIIFVCARESEIEKGSQSRAPASLYVRGRKEIELDADFVQLAGKTPHTRVYLRLIFSIWIRTRP
jgi:hypothetical protein